MDSQIELEVVPPGPRLDGYKDDIWGVLEHTDRDFVPPLSSRTPTTLDPIRPSPIGFPLPIEHLDFQLELNLIFARINQRTVGFLSFKPDFNHDILDLEELCVLVDTVAVISSARRKGVARALYQRFFALPEVIRNPWAVLHTWSTNRPHGELIESLGFEEIKRIPNDRAPGIDTLIYKRATTPNPFD